MGYKVSLIRVDFPLPDTPVTQTRQFKGIVILTSFRLFPEALLILKVLPAFKDIFLYRFFIFFSQIFSSY